MHLMNLMHLMHLMHLMVNRHFATFIITGCAKLSDTFLQNSEEKMIFESMRGRYEKVSFLAFKTKIQKKMKKSELKLEIKHSLK